jgi:hypothetical protein
VIEPARVVPRAASATTPTIANNDLLIDLLLPRLCRGAASNFKISTKDSLFIVLGSLKIRVS